MEENLLETNQSFVVEQEPDLAENSSNTAENKLDYDPNFLNNEGESLSKDPVQSLILGKFKSVEELTKAYQELQHHQGVCSDELGNLRKQVAEMNSFKQQLEELNSLNTQFSQIVSRDMEKYNSPEYFQDPTFREIYKEALMVFKDNIDTDKLVNLLESYANARIFANEKQKAAHNETQQVLNSMTYSKNPVNSITPPQKKFDEMSDKEIDEMLERLI